MSGRAGIAAVREFFCLDKMENLARTIKQQGGILGALGTFYRTDKLKDGTLVGYDQFGNRYYENNRYYVPRNRWVDYSRGRWLDYDGSQVPPEWHRWLHHMTDKPPTTHPPTERKWMMEHKENSLEPESKYIPYSTTRPKFQAWKPKQT